MTWVKEAAGETVLDTYALSTAYDMSTMAAAKTTTFQDPGGTSIDADDGPRSINFSANGLKLYIAIQFNATTTVENYIRQFDLSTACEMPATIDTDGYEYHSGGTLGTTVTELDVPHLDGRTDVCVVADGVVTCDVTPTDGTVSFDLAGRVHVGLPYTTDIETLDITSPDPSTGQDVVKSVAKVMVKFFKSIDNIWIGPNSDQLSPMTASNGVNLIGNGEDEDQEFHIEPEWNTNGRIFIRQSLPTPLTVLAIVPQFEEEDEASGGLFG